MRCSQAAYVLAARAPALGEIKDRLAAAYDWVAIGDGRVVADLPGVKAARLAVDVFAGRWLDDPEGGDGARAMKRAWSSRALGPGVAPGCLDRATRQAWAWPEAREAVAAHRAVVRLRILRGDAPSDAPDESAPRRELLALTEAAERLLALDGALCWFDAAGEALRPPSQVTDALAEHRDDGTLPIDLWTNVRVLALPGDDGWRAMDTVGLGQLRLPDLEVAFPEGRQRPEDADALLRGMADYLAGAGDVIATGHTVDGPDDTRWQVERHLRGLAAPTREVLRLTPDGLEPPPILRQPDLPVGAH